MKWLDVFLDNIQVSFNEPDEAVVTALVFSKPFNWVQAHVSSTPYEDPNHLIIDRDGLPGHLEIPLYIDQTILLQEYGDGRGTTLYIDKSTNTSEGWEAHTRYIFEDQAYETESIHLPGGYWYKFILFDYDGNNMFDNVPDLYISYYSGNGEQVYQQVSWTFRKESPGKWIIIDTTLP